MKQITLIFFIVLFAHSANCQQGIFYLAKYLREQYSPDAGTIPFDAPIKTALEKDVYKNLNVDTALLNTNPFFKNLFEPASGSGITSFIAPAIRNIGGLDVTNIADGLAQFLIKRGKEELNIAFFQRMKDFLDSNVEAKTLFPTTSAFLSNIESYRYAELLQSLREAFYKDINNLIVNLNLLIDLPKYQQLLKTLPEIRLAIRSAKIVSALSQPGQSLHPAELIDQLANLQEWSEINSNLGSSWKLLDIISQSVRKDTTTDSKVGWIKFNDFQNSILKDSITLKIFLGLLYQQVGDKSVSFQINGSITSVQGFMFDHSHDILMISDLIENFLLLANDVDLTIQDFNTKRSKDALTNDDYYSYINKAINVLEYGFKVANVIKPDIVNDKYIKIAGNANDLYKNIYTKNYNAAVMNAFDILDQALSKSGSGNVIYYNVVNLIKQAESDSAKAEKISDNLKKFALITKNIDTIELAIKDTSKLNNLIDDKEFVKELKNNLQSIKSITDNKEKLDTLVENLTKIVSLYSASFIDQKTLEKILRYGNMIASIVKAESAQEAEAAIEAAVLPAGSSSIKKNSAWNVSLNAYIGGYLGRSTNNTDEIDGNNSSVGVTAPIGIAVSKGLGYYWKNGPTIGSLSLYGTLIDVGAIAGYRLNDDSTALDQKITLNDIFTPGGYLVYGLGLPFNWASYIPLSVGYGWQYGSKLYYKKDDGKLAVSDKSRWRSNWFVAIDIPLANFWTKNYTKKK
jgi:hypothetical protein